MNLSESWNNEIAVLKRHLEVFEGTYTGFLDAKLQKKNP